MTVVAIETLVDELTRYEKREVSSTADFKRLGHIIQRLYDSGVFYAPCLEFDRLNYLKPGEFQCFEVPFELSTWDLLFGRIRGWRVHPGVIKDLPGDIAGNPIEYESRVGFQEMLVERARSLIGHVIRSTEGGTRTDSSEEVISIETPRAARRGRKTLAESDPQKVKLYLAYLWLWSWFSSNRSELEPTEELKLKVTAFKNSLDHFAMWLNSISDEISITGALNEFGAEAPGYLNDFDPPTEVSKIVSELKAAQEWKRNNPELAC